MKPTVAEMGCHNGAGGGGWGSARDGQDKGRRGRQVSREAGRTSNPEGERSELELGIVIPRRGAERGKGAEAKRRTLGETGQARVAAVLGRRQAPGEEGRGERGCDPPMEFPGGFVKDLDIIEKVVEGC